MVEFETIEAERIDYGRYGGENFVEVSRNKAIQDDGDVNTFIQIATGYHTEDGPRYKKRFTVPKNESAVQHIIDTLPGMLQDELDAAAEQQEADAEEDTGEAADDAE